MSRSISIDLVLQATGSHAWSVGRGWVTAAAALGILGKAFAPKSNWGDADTAHDDGLFKYIGNPHSSIIFLLGFDWHSQCLHKSQRWREAWKANAQLKILYLQESIANSVRLFQSSAPYDCLVSAASLADLIVYTDLSDSEIVNSTGLPSLWQPFGVDTELFTPSTPFANRINRAFFRGKTTPYGSNKTYSERRYLINYLHGKALLDVIPYNSNEIDELSLAKAISSDYNNYRISVNFPSIFSNHPTRVFEAMACGCAVITNKTGSPRVDNLFEHGRDLLYYQSADELSDLVQRLRGDASYSQTIANQGRKRVVGGFSLVHNLRMILNFAGYSIA